MDLFEDAREDIEHLPEPEVRVQHTPPNSPVRQPEIPVEPQNPAPIENQGLHNQDNVPPNRRAPARNQSRSRSRSPPYNPHQKSKYTVICY